MTTIIALVSAGILFISLEIFVPGGILGLLGAIAIIFACISAYDLYAFEGVIWVSLSSTVLTVIIVIAELKLLPKTNYGKRLFLNASIKGSGNKAVGDDSLIGHEAIAVTRLLPTGTINVKGQRHEAYSQDGHIHKGESLLIVGRDAFRIIVKKKS